MPEPVHSDATKVEPFHDLLRRLRETVLHLTPAELAKRIWVDIHTIERWETGERLPSQKNFRALKEVLGENGIELERAFNKKLGYDDLTLDELAAKPLPFHNLLRRLRETVLHLTSAELAEKTTVDNVTFKSWETGENFPSQKSFRALKEVLGENGIELERAFNKKLGYDDLTLDELAVKPLPFHNLLRRLRETVLHLTPAELAEKIKVDKKTVKRWEVGRTFPSQYYLHSLEEAFDYKSYIILEKAFNKDKHEFSHRRKNNPLTQFTEVSAQKMQEETLWHRK